MLEQRIESIVMTGGSLPLAADDVENSAVCKPSGCDKTGSGTPGEKEKEETEEAAGGERERLEWSTKARKGQLLLQWAVWEAPAALHGLFSLEQFVDGRLAQVVCCWQPVSCF